MAERVGWISIYRQIQDHWIWQDPVKFKWWIDILLTVNIEKGTINVGYQNIECNRGETLLSLQSWASRWKVSKDTARNFLKMLERENMIKCVSVGISTRLTVCNYDGYQNCLHVKQTASKRQANGTPTLLNNDDKENNNNKVFIAPTLEDVILYFSENSYPEWLAQKAFKYYNDADWKDSKGKKVKFWKQKMQGVWFNEENKINTSTPILKLQH